MVSADLNLSRRWQDNLTTVPAASFIDWTGVCKTNLKDAEAPNRFGKIAPLGTCVNKADGVIRPDLDQEPKSRLRLHKCVTKVYKHI